MSNRGVPLIVHLIYRLDFGGLETLLVEVVNRMPADQYRHAIICLSDYTDFAKKITKPDVEIFALHKPPGLGLATHVAIWKLLRKLRPAILHSYNLSAIEYTVAATMAGVPIRVHAEHGREATDPEGKNPKHNLLRRLMIPFVDAFVPVSDDLQKWLRLAIGVPKNKNTFITNGVDTVSFAPKQLTEMASHVVPFSSDCFVIGTVGRVQDVKNHKGLIEAFLHLLKLIPTERSRLRVAIVGDGPLLPAIRKKIVEEGIQDLVWTPGARTNIAEIMRSFTVFALPSIAEGTPVTILEAMATGLPVVATRVGGVPEVVQENVTGSLVRPGDAMALATSLAKYVTQPALLAQHGAAGRARIEQKYSMTTMLKAYLQLYDSLCDKKITHQESH